MREERHENDGRHEREDQASPGHALGLSSTMHVRWALSAHGDDVDVEVARVANTFSTTPFAGARRASADSHPGRSGFPFTASKGHERGRGVVVDDLLELALELLDEFARSQSCRSGRDGSRRP